MLDSSHIRPIILDPQEVSAVKAAKKTQHRIIADRDSSDYLQVGQLLKMDDGTLLRVMACRCESLQDIDQDDVIAHGLNSRQDAQGFYWYGYHHKDNRSDIFYLSDFKQVFEAYWANKHGDGSWGSNPDVFVIEFEIAHALMLYDVDLFDVSMMNGTSFSLMKQPDNRLLISMKELDMSDDGLRSVLADRLLERQALALRDKLLALYPL